MIEAILFILTLGAALGSGLIAGVFFAFSSFVMKALGRLDPNQGILAMQSINVVVLNPWFLGVFMGTAAMGGVLAASAVLTWGDPGSAWRLAGGVLYVFGCFGVTLGFNVPRNEALAAVDPASAGGAALWSRYLVEWTRWNHVRTVASLLASAALIVALWTRAASAAA